VRVRCHLAHAPELLTRHARTARPGSRRYPPTLKLVEARQVWSDWESLRQRRQVEVYEVDVRASIIEGLGVPGHHVGDRRLMGGFPPSAL
jgi:hypothetical protein